VVCSTSIALIFKISEARNMDRYTVTTFNYLVASAVSVFLLLSRGTSGISITGAFESFTGQIGSVMGSGGSFDVPGSAGWAAAVGVPSGVLYFLGFMYLQKAVRETGVSLAGSFSKMGVLVPMVLAIFLWKELPGSIQWAGIALALTAILLANLDLSRPGRILSGFQPVLLALFITVGLSEFSNKVYQRYGDLEMKSLFLFFVFAGALLISSWKLIRSGRRIEGSHVLTGLAVGLPNYFASFFLILSLSRLKTAVVFPIYSAATITLLSLAGHFFFGEKLKTRERAAVILTVASLVLVNAK
jgi:drug/metabolite transporter (DMT)-like permease